MPTMSAIGVARPSAQGQAITITASAKLSAEANPAPAANQAKKVTSAMAITVQTNFPAIRSASRAIGGRDPCASSTSRMIRASSSGL